MKNKLLALILVISILLLAGCSAAITSNESAILYESYESNEKKQEMLQLKYNENSSAFYANETRDIEGKALYVLLQYEISPRIFKYTAADFGITDESKIKEIKDLGIDEWKYDPYELGVAFEIHRELQIILNESNKDYLFELAKKVYELPFVYGVSVDYEEGPYTDYNIEEEICQTIIKKDFPDFENKEKAKQYMMQREYSNEKNLNIPKENNIICKEIYIFLMHEISLCEYEYTAADFGITDVSKIKEIKDLGMAGWMDKTNLDNKQEIRIILNELSVTDAKALAQKIYDLPFVKKVSLEYEFESLPEVLESTSIPTDGANDDSGIKEIFEKNDKSYSSKPIVVLNSFEELESITKELQAANENYSASSKYAEQTKKYTKDFFEKNVLFMAYFVEGSGSYSHRITALNISEVMSVQISTIRPHESADCAMAGYVVFFELPEEKIKNVKKIELTTITEQL